MRYVLLAAIVFLVSLVSLKVESQTVNPCDTGLGTGTQTVTLASATSPFSVGACQKATDTNGQPTTITTLVVQIDGAEVYRGLPAGAIGPNANGETYYATPKTLTSTIGNHTVTVSAANAAGQGAGTSRPFVLKLAATVPVAPSSVDAHP